MESSLSGLVMFGCKTKIKNNLNYIFLAYITVWGCGVGEKKNKNKTWVLTRQPGKDLIDPL